MTIEDVKDEECVTTPSSLPSSDDLRIVRDNSFTSNKFSSSKVRDGLKILRNLDNQSLPCQCCKKNKMPQQTL